MLEFMNMVGIALEVLEQFATAGKKLRNGDDPETALEDVLFHSPEMICYAMERYYPSGIMSYLDKAQEIASLDSLSPEDALEASWDMVDQIYMPGQSVACILKKFEKERQNMHDTLDCLTELLAEDRLSLEGTDQYIRLLMSSADVEDGVRRHSALA